ncbi:MAG TPA: prolipoprotein diacylglyceryl transferase family protein [Bryobacteraceae bacterium]|nr:prolipoprotein diacylglyceryl transferase family protein [Bryobacteraceae bacterium]
MMLGKILYGALFVVLLPGLLILWAVAAQPNVRLPAYGNTIAGSALAAGGLGLMFAAMRDLWRFGGGLPMNAFPPAKLVSRGTFQWIPHPIYTGFVATCLGVSMTARSAAGLWLVTPGVVLACAALVLGYERLDLKRRFGDTLRLLPADDGSPPSNWDRVRFIFVVLIPWLALYEFSINMRLPGIAFAFEFEDRFRIYSWTVFVYQTSYITAVLSPWCAQTRRELRQLMITAWVAMAVVFPFYWIIPSSAPRRVLEDSSWIARLLDRERTTYPPAAAFPSFHTLWAIFVGRLYRPRWLGIAYVVAISIVCITTGMHYIPDVLAALVIAPLFLEPQRVWKRLLGVTEWIANSWREWRIGSVRVINYAFYAGSAAFVQVAIVTAALGPGREWKAVITALAGLAGAAALAQWIEGSSLLRRPFGFYGGLIGVGLTCLFFEERWTLLGAHCLGAPWMQAIGRLRCLVNGCCHGAPAPPGVGIQVTDAHSRVTRLAKLTGVAIYPTQLYSIICNIFVGIVLARLWWSGCPLSLICGVYLIGNGIPRFVEEAYRGEPQTSMVWGLHVYQWIAIGSVIVGAALTTLRSPGAPMLAPSSRGFLCALALALLCAAAMGVDFPESNRPLARLT